MGHITDDNTSCFIDNLQQLLHYAILIWDWGIWWHKNSIIVHVCFRKRSYHCYFSNSWSSLKLIWEQLLYLTGLSHNSQMAMMHECINQLYLLYHDAGLNFPIWLWYGFLGNALMLMKCYHDSSYVDTCSAKQLTKSTFFIIVWAKL